MCEKDSVWNHITNPSKNGKYLESIIDDSVITCDQIIEVIKTIPKKKTIPINFNGKKVTWEIENFYILRTFLSNTISLLIILDIYCCLVNIDQNKNIYYHITIIVIN